MKKNYSFLVLILIYNSTFATIRNVPSTYATIQAALTACVAGDTVRVQPGTYIGHLTWPNIANIKLYAVGDSSNTIISGNNLTNVISFSSLSAVYTNTVVRGFKITAGYLSGSSTNGGGVYISGCSPKFTAVAITGNHLNAANWGYGAGVYCNNSSAHFYNSSIRANITDSASWGYGGGVYLAGGGTTVFKNVRIESNVVNSTSWNYGTGVYCTGASTTLVNCTVRGNSTGSGGSWYYGTGIYFESGTLNLINVLVASNTQNTGGNWYYGAGIYINYTSVATTVNMMNVTVTDNHKNDNTSITGPGLYVSTTAVANITNSIFWDNNTSAEFGTTGTINVNYSDIRGGHSGTANIMTNPAFVSATDFHITGTSPCVNTGTPTGAPPYDLDNNLRPAPVGSNPDMGCYEFNCVPTPTSINLPSSLDTLCSTAGTVNLTGAIPAGGTYSGTGVSGTSFNTVTAGIGLHTVTYSFTNGTGCTGYDSATIYVYLCSGIADYYNESSVSVYPNPFTSQTKIVFTEQQKNASVKITDMIGKEIKSIHFSGKELIIERGDMETGIYFLEVTNQISRINKKIVVQ